MSGMRPRVGMEFKRPTEFVMVHNGRVRFGSRWELRLSAVSALLKGGCTSVVKSIELACRPVTDGQVEPSTFSGIHEDGEAMFPELIANSLVQAILTNERFAFPQTVRGRLNKRVKDALGTTPDKPLGALVQLVAEADLRAFDARRGGLWWSRAYYLLGVPAAVLATIAGAIGLAETASRFTAAIIALVAAGLTAAATFLNSEQNSKTNKHLSAAWQELADETRIMLLQYAQKMEREPDVEVLDADYWNSVLDLQRRKGKLLRGDMATLGD